MKVVPTFKVIEGWEKLPAGYVHKDVDGVAVDSRDNVYLMTRKDARIMVYDRSGNFLRSWGEGGLFTNPTTTTDHYFEYPFREMGTWMFFMGFAAIILGVIIFVIQDHIYKPQIIEKIKVRCEYCNGLMDESEDKCPGCGGR